MKLPEVLAPLKELSANLWWCWNHDAIALWRDLDPFRWDRSRQTPGVLLRDVEPSRLEELANDEDYVARVRAVHARLTEYLDDRSTWRDRAAPEVGLVAYLSMEFGLHQSLRIYSGGLGVLAGDHLKSASDLGLPLIGVTLFWKHGYFRQVLDDARQMAIYPENEPTLLGLQAVADDDGKVIEVSVPLGELAVTVRAWRLAVGRATLLMLDVDHDGNPASVRNLTHHLYGGDHHTRIRQEAVLGLGAVRMIRAMGLEPQTWHLNEGHCAFATLELLREKTAAGLPLQKALEVREQVVFTTHTPVPAGHDRFSWDEVNPVFGAWEAENGWRRGQIMDLGRERPGDWNDTLCMTVLALRMSRAANGVSALHGEVSRQMWKHLWPTREAATVPIGHVTNGVHPHTWMSAPAAAVFDEFLSAGWRDRFWDTAFWGDEMANVPDEMLWQLRRVLRTRLADRIRTTMGRNFRDDALTLGFARRFATYKRGDMLFSDPDRLEAVLTGPHPVQIVFSGKAHPKDIPGQAILARVVRFSEDRRFRDRIAFVEDYDMAIGAALTSGADVWVNNPRRPQEASGTSGQKVPLNGGINLSILDGWWPEAFDGTNGFAIGDETEYADQAAQDEADAESLYVQLEQGIVPEWSDRDPSGLPRRWLARVRRSMATCIPAFSSHRMVRDYVRDYYRLPSPDPRS